MSNDMKNEQDTKQKLAKAYQEASDETTSPELDASIMAFAQKELESRQQAENNLSWWTRLKLPVSMAAALVVTVGIARFMVELGYGQPDFAEHYSSESTAAQKTNTIVLQDEHFTEQDIVASAPAKKEKISQRQILEQREQELQRLAVVGARVQNEEVARSKKIQQAEQERSYMADAAALEAKEIMHEDATLALTAKAAEPPEKNRLPSAEVVEYTGSQDAIDAPYLPAEEWLAKIESLLESGDKEKAKEQWKKFKKIYPNFPIETPKKQRLEQI
ncbi:hypothetical protein [Kangiella spongicola]|uniref:Uncharacterized protein n=1 Tax=Kangiella spongicola TaxID=796379 RepID=A0A318D999_9GAMM|nr:hypothetical protein [Kangiella spongicola]PXF64505.1 hypothetical protein DL796_05025 [Kangiella spongicola]